MDIIIATYSKINSITPYTYEKKVVAIFTPSVEFGWRYTFGFGLSFQALMRLGLHIDTNITLGFYGLVGIGVGYSF
jgi:hypothetical protein